MWINQKYLKSLHNSGRVSQPDAPAERTSGTDISVNDLHPFLFRLLSSLVVVLHMKWLPITSYFFVIIRPQKSRPETATADSSLPVVIFFTVTSKVSSKKLTNFILTFVSLPFLCFISKDFYFVLNAFDHVQIFGFFWTFLALKLVSYWRDLS